MLDAAPLHGDRAFQRRSQPVTDAAFHLGRHHVRVDRNTAINCAHDALDLRALWAATRFNTPDDAVTAFYTAYPHEELDPFLADWIRTVVTEH